MTLTAVRIANFKAFGASQRIPFRPITLIFGANSAGKSSVLHALALAHHAIETGELDTQRTQIGGESIDLGGFRQYVHRRQRDQQVELTFELEPGHLTGRAAELLRTASSLVVEVGIGMGVTGTQLGLFGDASREVDPAGAVRVERFSVEVDGKTLLTMSARPGGILRLDRLDAEHRVLRDVFRGLVALASWKEEVRDEDLVGLEAALDAIVPIITARSSGLIPRIEQGTEKDAAEGLGVPLTLRRERWQEDLASAARLFLPAALRDLVGGLAAALEAEIRKLRYLGPLRSYPPRHLAFAQHHDPNWFAGGGYAWDVVRTREDVRRMVNLWLSDAKRLKTPYELEVRDLLPATAVSAELPSKLAKDRHDLTGWLLRKLHGEGQAELVALADRLADRLEDYDPDDPFDTEPELEAFVADADDADARSARWVEEMVASRSEALQDLILIDKRTGTPVSHRDVGIGVSQVLPVLVSAYASNGRLLAIEQPEIHLHPALQAELGDVFLGSALGEGGNTFLVETHSEHLLLRIMRRMRETSTGELPPGMPGVRPEDVMVLFVEPDGSRSIIREMPLNERGELVKAWPGGFFEEGLREIF